jgi:hypothetical protein
MFLVAGQFLSLGLLLGIALLFVVLLLASSPLAAQSQTGETSPASEEPNTAPEPSTPSPAKPAGQSDATAQGIAFFEKKIRPVLVEHCAECHFPQTDKEPAGGLLLNSRAASHRGGDSGPAVVPGKVDESLLLDALRYDGFEMPPQGKLPQAVIDDFTAWIKLGAPDPRVAESAPVSAGVDLEQGRQYWSFQQPRKTPPPEVQSVDWPRDEVDRFILARLEALELQPAGDADRAVLLRRVYFDLTGLPPSVEAQQRFLAATDPQALAREVDRLLASEEFGQRWGRHWLDVARYAESSGGGRSQIFPNAWRYRDYVIDAFNTDKPYDRFVREQVAGDLLPHESDSQRSAQLIATGFLALGPKNLDNQDKELLRMDVVDEQIDTLGRAFLGMTLGCARCHDHKFDPVPTKDYYALAGIFRSTKSLLPGNVSGFVQEELPVEAARRKMQAEHAKQQKAIEKEIASAKAQLKRLQQEIKLAGIVVDDRQARLTGSWQSSKHSPHFVGESYLHDDRQGQGTKRAEFVPELPSAGVYEVRVAYNHGETRETKVPVVVRHAEGESIQHLNQKKAPSIGGLFTSVGRFRFDPQQAPSVTITNNDATGHVIVDAVQFVRVKERAESSADKGQPGTTTADSDAAAMDLSSGVAVGIETAATEQADKVKADHVKTADEKTVREKTVREADQNKADSEREFESADRLDSVSRELKQLEAQLGRHKKNAPPTLPRAMCVIDEAEVDDCPLCIRGNVHNVGDPVPRGFLSFMDPSPETISPGQSGRLELAQWLSSLENPLVARVMVNRVWQKLFGQGLVRSVDNFGLAGETPSHPELLDYLAVEFVEQGWSVKQLIRRLVLSRTYQMSTVVEERPAADPENRLLWRMRRKRLEAEALRDSILAISGALDPRAGGSTIRPGTESEFGYEFDTHRRSVYVPVFRNALHDAFTVFDFADPNLVIGQRNVSTLPAQALYLMNSPMLIRQSRQAAERLLQMPDLDDTARIEMAYRQTLNRQPSREERALAAQYVAAAVTADQADGLKENNRSGESLDDESPNDESRGIEASEGETKRIEAWAGLYQALFGSIDFRYVN